jgi:UDP-N-acetylmuramate--alanine ligase
VIVRYGLPVTQADTQAKVYTYGADEPKADFYAEILDDFGHFNLHHPGGVIENCEINVPGLINVENATGAAAIALTYGLDPQKVKDALASFAGVKRRFDVHYKTESCVFLDDFAHNPEEIAASLKTIRRAYPGRKLTAVFQPHLFTRTRDFASEFAQVLSTADKVVMTEIYPAREEPIPGVTSDIIFDHVQAPEKTLLKRCELVEWVKNNDNELMVTLGCGDIGLLADEISAVLREKNA